MNLGHIGFPGITLVIMKRAWKMHFQPPHNEIKCVLSIKESYPKRGKNAKVFTNIYGLRVPPPLPSPYGQPGHKISNFTLHLPQGGVQSLKNTRYWYPIDALGAIFAIFTTLDVMVVVFQPDVRQKVL